MAVLLGACAEPRARDKAPGGLAPTGPLAPARAEPEAELIVPADPAAVLERLTSVGVRSRGHAGGVYQVTIFANPAGAKLWRERLQRALAGALFVAEHRSLEDASPGPLLLMQKQGAGYDPGAGDWQFAWAESPTKLLRSGRLVDCSACHAAAETDYVFIAE